MGSGIFHISMPVLEATFFLSESHSSMGSRERKSTRARVHKGQASCVPCTRPHIGLVEHSQGTEQQAVVMSHSQSGHVSLVSQGDLSAPRIQRRKQAAEVNSCCVPQLEGRAETAQLLGPSSRSPGKVVSSSHSGSPEAPWPWRCGP